MDKYEYDEMYYNPTDGWTTEQWSDYEDGAVDTLDDMLNYGFSLIDFGNAEIF